MPFLKRALSDQEFSAVDWGALGIAPKRIPPSNWSWSVDPARQLFCTQLLSDTSEMREGRYWYLLLFNGKPVIFEVDAFSSSTSNGKPFVEAAFTKIQLTGLDEETVEELASEAHAAASFRGEQLRFKKKSRPGENGAQPFHRGGRPKAIAFGRPSCQTLGLTREPSLSEENTPMTSSLLLYPMAAHIGLTAILYTLLTIARAPSVWGVGRAPDGSNPWANAERRLSANLSNQFEWPLFFYAAALLLLQRPIVGQLELSLAWLFVVGRVAHSCIQVFTTNVRLRGIVFTVNFLAVLAMWATLVVRQSAP